MPEALSVPSAMDGMATEVYFLEGGLAVIVIASAARQSPRILGFIYLSGFFPAFLWPFSV